MPLTKRAETAPSVASSVAAAALPPAGTPALPTEFMGTQPVAAAKRLGGTRKPGEKAETPLTKEGYWDRKEVRDIETGIRIRRSGVWQASLQSVGILQLNRENTLESFLALVEKAANAGLDYVNKD